MKAILLRPVLRLSRPARIAGHLLALLGLSLSLSGAESFPISSPNPGNSATLAQAKSVAWGAVSDKSQFMIGGYLRINDGGGGNFYIDKEDHSSRDNGGTIFIAADGTRLKRLITSPVDVRWFGAAGDGKQDDTQAITAAWNYCINEIHYPRLEKDAGTPEISANTLHFPPGDYIFNGPSLTLNKDRKIFRLSGDGASGSRIRIESSDYFIKIGDISALSITDIQFSGGKGVLKIANTGANVRGVYTIRNCSFFNYSECAIGHLASDMPAWRIENNVFFGSSQWNSIGVALSGLTDNSVIRENQFQRNRYGVKIKGGFNAYIRNNDFLRFTPPVKDTADIWIVPVNTLASQGLVIAENKFGNENLRQTDWRILIASEDANGDFVSAAHSSQDLGDRMRVGLLQIRDNNFVSMAGYKHGVITSYTSDLRYIHSDNMFSGGYPPQIVEFPVGFTQTRVNSESIHDASQFYNSTEGIVPPLSETPIGLTRDPWGNLAGEDFAVQYFTTGDDPAYEPLVSPDQFIPILVGSVQRSIVTDAFGNDRALDLKWSDRGNYIQAPFNVAVARKPTWVEFDFKQTAKNPLKTLVVDIRPKSGSTAVFRRTIRVPEDWQRVRFLWFPSEKGEYRLVFPDGMEPYEKGKSEGFEIARLHIYQAHEPVANGGLLRGSALVLQPRNQPNDSSGKAVIYIDRADGLPKIQASDGTIRTIVTKPE